MTVTSLVPAAAPLPRPRSAPTPPARPSLPGLRRVPPPATEPAATAFDGATAHGPRHPALVEGPRPVPSGLACPTPLRVAAAEAWGPQPTPRGALPDPRIWARRLVTAVLEVQAGTRPPVQLARYLDDRVYASVRRARTTPTSAGGSSAGRLRSVRICEPGDAVVEATAVVERGGRACAIALRLEGIGGRWICTVFEALVPQGATAPSMRKAS